MKNLHKNEISELLINFDHFIDSLNNLIGKIKGSIEKTINIGTDLSKISNESTQLTEDIKSKISNQKSNSGSRTRQFRRREGLLGHLFGGRRIQAPESHRSQDW